MATVARAFSSVLRESGRQRYYATKRALDITVAVLLLATLSPLIVLVAVVQRASSRGPLLFGHVRCGQNGRAFTCWKFRTMRHGLEQAEFLEAPALAVEFAREYKLTNDPRVTRLGRLLRRSSLDELPQLWNVITGDMSIVGPRPVLRSEISEMYGPYADLVLSVRPGITGIWQVSGRSSLSYPERVALDVDYVRRQSLRLDLAVISKTPAAVITMRGAV